MPYISAVFLCLTAFSLATPPGAPAQTASAAKTPDPPAAAAAVVPPKPDAAKPDKPAAEAQASPHTPPSAGSAQAAAIAAMQPALAAQKAATEKQRAGAASFFTLPWSSPPAVSSPATADCDPIADAEVTPIIAAAATANQMQPDLLRAVIRQESAFRPCAVSPKGAMGLMQLMPETAQQLQVNDPLDPTQNIQSGARYLKQLLEQFGGDVKLALAAYNAGPARVDGKVPDIPETQNYVQQILKELEKNKP